jgi:protein TonB
MFVKRPNWLFLSLVIVSIGVHAVIFIHISGLYQSNALTWIELTLKDISKTPTRNIPKPRYRPKEPLLPKDIKHLKVVESPIPSFKPVKMVSLERTLSDTLIERLSMPEMFTVSNVSIAALNFEKITAASEFYTSPKNYLEMVKLKIERNKRYPENARNRQIQGEVTLRFVITPLGNIKAIEMVKKSGYRSLDEAAVNAVKGAAPFPEPPKQFFKGSITMVITISFELI